MKKISTGINGFGRFGLHLLKYWLDRSDECPFQILSINDSHLLKEKILGIINSDYSVVLNSYKFQLSGSVLQITSPDGNNHEINITNENDDKIPWIGEYDLFLECSGVNTIRKNCEKFLSGNTKLVAISATSWDSDKTLVYGFNQKDLDLKKDKIISYGSCTVNAFVPLANFINNQFGVVNSDVNVIHNIQRYRMDDNYTLNRKFCTLEKSAVDLLPFVNENNFKVNYTVIPYEYVSMIDFRFELNEEVSQKKFIDKLTISSQDGVLSDLYDLENFDNGPEVFNCTSYSSVIIKDGIKKIGKNIYLQAYFDNENSVNRYYDLVSYISNCILKGK
jgi:glyceraldehyde 3-phosphate dehydrogenase